MLLSASRSPALTVVRALRAPVRIHAHAASAAAAAKMAPPKLKLTYFHIKARAEPTRLALFIGGIPFEDVRVEHKDWPAMKEKMPYAQIPVRETT